MTIQCIFALLGQSNLSKVSLGSCLAQPLQCKVIITAALKITIISKHTLKR